MALAAREKGLSLREISKLATIPGPYRGRAPADMLAPVRRAVAAQASERAGRVRTVSVAAAATAQDGVGDLRDAFQDLCR